MTSDNLAMGAKAMTNTTPDTRPAWRVELESFTPYGLSNMAECGEPDTPESPGAAMLVHVRDDVAERIAYHVNGGATVLEAVDLIREGDDVWEVADGAPGIYTHERWAQFVDLAAYQEDLTTFGEPSDFPDMTQAAGVALYMIAERLVFALCDAVDELEGGAV